MTKKKRIHAELHSMEIYSLNVLWKAAYRWMEAAAGRGLGRDMAPHQRVGARRIAERALDRYFDALAKVKTKDRSWLTKLTTPKSGSSLPSAAPKKK